MDITSILLGMLAIAISIAGGCYYLGKNIGNLSKDVRGIRDATTSVAKIIESIGDYMVRRGINDILNGLREIEKGNPLTVQEEKELESLLIKARRYNINADEGERLTSLLEEYTKKSEKDEPTKFLITLGIGAFIGYILAKSAK